MRPDRQSGFTLIELMVAIAVLAVLLAMGLPSFQYSLRSNRVATATNEMLASVSLARSEAIRSTAGGGVCSSSDGAACNGGWGDGWLVWADTNADGTLDAGEAVLRYSRGNGRLTANGPNEAIAFDARGRRRAAADQALTLRPSDCGGHELQRTLTINAAGQVRTVKGACP
jgi:type IV fimbrial biogenesis protein FimT